MNKRSERPSAPLRSGRVVQPPVGPLLIDYTPVPPYVPLFVSDNVTDHLGYAPGEIIGSPNFLINVIHVEDIPLFLSGLFHLFLRDYHVYEYRLQRKNRTFVRMLGEIRLRRGSDGAPLKITSSFADMTSLGEDSWAGGALSAASSLGGSGAMDLTIDCGGRIRHAGPAVKKVLGYKANDVVGRHVLEFIPLDYHIIVSKVLMRMLECCQDTLYFWTAAKHRDSTLRFIVNECRGLFDERGERTIAAKCHDITSRLDRIKSATGHIGRQIPPSVFRAGYGRPETATSDPFATLTSREREVFYLTSEGYSSTQIGMRLFISPRTVEAHRASLMKKLNVRTISQLIRFAVCRIAYPTGR